MNNQNQTKTMTEDATNTEHRRAEQAYRAVIAYYDVTELGMDDAIADLLCDLMHECSLHRGDNFDELLQQARDNFMVAAK